MKNILVILILIGQFSVVGQSGLMKSELSLSDYAQLKTNFKEALKKQQYDSAEVIAQQIIDATDESPKSFYYGMGLYHLSKAQLKRFKHIESLENMLAARSIFITLDSLEQILYCDRFIGSIYEYEGDYETLFLYDQHGLEVSLKLGDTTRIASWYNHIGNSNMHIGNYDEALKSERLCLKYALQTNNLKEASYGYSTIGEIHYLQGRYDSATYYMDKSLAIKDQLGLPIAWLKSKIGKVYIKTKNYNKAIEACNEGFEESKGKGSQGELFCTECLTEAYGKNGNYARAYELQKYYTHLKEERDGVKRYKDMTRAAYTDLYNKKAEADSLRHLQAQLVKDQELAHENKLKNYLYLILGIVLLFLMLMINRFRVIRKQRNQIATQKDKAERLQKESDEQRLIVEQKNKEITDSILYAKRIQTAILPSAKLVKEYLKESFILYKPKDVVAGDFYWMEHKDGKVLYAAADCTGHGVPGAMVSVICNNGLNRSVREYGLTDPGKILDKTREIVIQEFNKSEEDVKDGMDIALCSLDGMKLQYAGAHNALWIIRNGELIETKANKQPIGVFDYPEPYTTHSFDLEPGDAIYIFSDGYVDQFGGEKGKKFKAAAFRSLLLSIQDKSLEDQKTIIDEAFENWKGDIEQIDDVCVIGVRV
ncbi:MAG: SpoIIE family protein phosphatase [Vicingaceae bacterium]|nr:SpoIIE family protein phosphatase [Vicingaceae bacterium]